MNVDNTILASGTIGGGGLSLVNDASGIIEASGALVIDTGASAIVNAGTIEGSLTVNSAIDNTGLISANVTLNGAVTNAGTLSGANVVSSVDNSGVVSGGYLQGPVENAGTLEAENDSYLTVSGAVTGAGVVDISSIGFAAFLSSFNEDVNFLQNGSYHNMLTLAQGQDYTGAISGFSGAGLSVLDLRDIGFVNAGEATFSGTAKGGILTVTDGAHTAHINLLGDYRHGVFVAATDNDGGVEIILQSGDVPTPRPAAFVAAMAGLGGGAAATPHTVVGGHIMSPAMLAAPRIAIA